MDSPSGKVHDPKKQMEVESVIYSPAFHQVSTPQPVFAHSSGETQTPLHSASHISENVSSLPQRRAPEMREFTLHTPQVRPTNNIPSMQVNHVFRNEGPHTGVPIQHLSFVASDNKGSQPSPISSSSIYNQAVSTLGQSPSVYSRISNISNNPNLGQLPAEPVEIFDSPPHYANVFKSPLHVDSNLMELRNVTPSRISASPRQICGQTGKEIAIPQISNKTTTQFTSPPPTIRFKGADGSEIKPIITKRSGGKISITYPLEMLANYKWPQVNLPALTSQSTPAMIPTQDCFTQFLGFPLNPPSSINIEKEIDSTPCTVPAQTVVTEMRANEPSSSNSEESRERMEIDDDQEERENVEKITKALNIECDVYKETKANAKKTGTRVHSRLPKEVHGLMGEANLCYARGDHEAAIKMCLEIVRTAPYSAEPFDTLAMIYEEKGDRIKALQYALLSTHLQATDVDQWVRMAESCEEVGFLQHAVHCYKKASKLKPEDYRLRWAAAVLQQQMGNLRQALELFKSVVNLLPDTEVMQCMALARDIARACHANNETPLAVEVMDEVLMKHPDHVKYEDVNVLCELALASKQYRKVFDVMVRHCELQYESENGSEDELQLTSIQLSEHLPVDLQCKVILACIHLDCLHLVKTNLEEILAMDPTDIGDLQFDIAESLIELKNLPQAIHILDILVSSPDYSLAAVWLKKGECHHELGQVREEILCFREVVKLAPGHTKAYLALCKALMQSGRYEEAAEVIDEAETYEMEDEESMLVSKEKLVVYQKCADTSVNRKHVHLCKVGDTALLMLANKLEAAFMLAKTVVLKRRNRRNKRYKGEIRLTRRVGGNHYKLSNKKSLMARGCETVLSEEEWWQLFATTVSNLVKCERFMDAITLADAALFYATWYGDIKKRTGIQHIAVCACMIGGNFALAYTFLRPWLFQHPSNIQLWNIFNQITIRSQDQRHHRFCLRFLVKEPENMALAVLNGHNSLATGTYKHSLGEYVRAHKNLPTEPMFMLLIGIIYTHIASQKFTSHRNSLVIHAYAFFDKYMKHRKCDQESFYNIGRCMHQLGLLHYASAWYKKALEAKPPEINMDSRLIDLSCEAAYNLAIIYRKSGNVSLANKILEDHCVI